jgi:FkbM family methyltransferase
MPTTARDLFQLIWNHPSNRGRRGRVLVGAALWQAWKRSFRRPLDLTVYDDMTFRAHPDSSQPGRFIYFGGLPDYEEMTFMHRYLRPGDGFIDGGANEGMFTLLAGKLVGQSGAVHAFEAVPVHVDRLRENVRANRLAWVTVHPDAVGAEPAVMPFVLRGAGSRIQTSEDRATAAATVDVNIVRLDDALPDRRWAMGKLDVEGAELQALKGAEQLFARAEPAVWMLELVERFLNRFDSSLAGVREWLDARGYDLVQYDVDANQLVPVDGPLPDALAVSRARRVEIEDRLRGDEPQPPPGAACHVSS